MSPELVNSTYDAIVIGSGMGGSTFAYSLATRGLRVAVIEKGERLDGAQLGDEPVHSHHYQGRALVGGQTKTYGAALYRLRKSDFMSVEMESGVSPAWPWAYEELEPYYGAAEALFKVHGSSWNDPTEPPRSTPWPHPPIPHQGPVVELVHRLTDRAGVPVAFVPRGIDYDPLNGGKCTLCKHCDAYICPRSAKMDAETAALLPAMAAGRVDLFEGTECLRILTSTDGKKVSGVEVRKGTSTATLLSGIVASCGGLLETPLLFWRSRNAHHPMGLSNPHGALGRFWATHTQAWIFPISLGAQRKPFHQKTFAINTHYERSAGGEFPLGVIQSAGSIEPVFMGNRYKRYIAETLLNHSFQCFVMNEALPSRESGFALSDSGATKIGEPRKNPRTFQKLRKRAADIFRAAGYTVISPPGTLNYHSVGTARMGTDIRDSVVDPNGQSHNVKGLFVVDSSSLPTSGALNSGLTIAAVALRAAERVQL